MKPRKERGSAPRGVARRGLRTDASVVVSNG